MGVLRICKTCKLSQDWTWISYLVPESKFLERIENSNSVTAEYMSAYKLRGGVALCGVVARSSIVNNQIGGRWKIDSNLPSENFGEHCKGGRGKSGGT